MHAFHSFLFNRSFTRSQPLTPRDFPIKRLIPETTSVLINWLNLSQRERSLNPIRIHNQRMSPIIKNWLFVIKNNLNFTSCIQYIVYGVGGVVPSLFLKNKGRIVRGVSENGWGAGLGIPGYRERVWYSVFSATLAATILMASEGTCRVRAREQPLIK